jgi:hypothetical protein
MKKYIKRIGIIFINSLCIFPLLCLLFFTGQNKEIEELLTLLNQ